MLIKLICGQCGYNETIEVEDQELKTIVCKRCGCTFGFQCLGSLRMEDMRVQIIQRNPLY